MIDNEIRKRVEAATVRLTNKGGQGVLVPGNMILTAAHCVEWNTEGGMTLGDYCFEMVQTRDGTKFRAAIAAVEPVADIAALVSMDNQEFCEDAEAFEQFADATSSVPMATDDWKWEEWFSIYVLSHKGHWIPGKAAKFGEYAPYPPCGVVIYPDIPLEGGTSGGPVVDDLGRLVGVVSWSGGVVDEPQTGRIPFPEYALPQWVVTHVRTSVCR